MPTPSARPRAHGSCAVVCFQVDHPNCIKLYDVYITPRKVYLVTELVTGGELLDRCAATLHATLQPGKGRAMAGGMQCCWSGGTGEERRAGPMRSA